MKSVARPRIHVAFYVLSAEAQRVGSGLRLTRGARPRVEAYTPGKSGYTVDPAAGAGRRPRARRRTGGRPRQAGGAARPRRGRPSRAGHPRRPAPRSGWVGAITGRGPDAAAAEDADAPPSGQPPRGLSRHRPVCHQSNVCFSSPAWRLFPPTDAPTTLPRVNCAVAAAIMTALIEHPAGSSRPPAAGKWVYSIGHIENCSTRVIHALRQRAGC